MKNANAKPWTWWDFFFGAVLHAVELAVVCLFAIWLMSNWKGGF